MACKRDARHDGPTFFTTQNISAVFCAYRVFSRQELVTSMESLGYQLVDSWATPRKVIVPGHPDKSTGHYGGFYFRAAQGGTLRVPERKSGQ